MFLCSAKTSHNSLGLLDCFQEATVGEAHSLNLESRLSQHLAAIQKLNDKIAQLWKRNKPQGRPSPHGERWFGDAPEAGYV